MTRPRQYVNISGHVDLPGEALEPESSLSLRALALAVRERLLARTPKVPRTTDPEVSVVVLNRNGAECLERCLAHLIHQTYKRFEVIVVDNGSSDSSADTARRFEHRLNLRFIEAKTNRGVAGGRNLGTELARGELVAFLDNDGYAAPDWLDQAIATLSSRPELGAVASTVFFADNPLVLNGAGGARDESWRGEDLEYGEAYERAQIPAECLFPMGCGMVIRGDALRDIGALDESTRKWFDDVELGLRLWSRGWRVGIAKRAVIDHGFHSFERLSSIPDWETAFTFERMRMRTALKYASPAELRRWIVVEARGLLRALFKVPKHACILGLSGVWNLLRSPSAIAIRRRFPASRETRAFVRRGACERPSAHGSLNDSRFPLFLAGWFEPERYNRRSIRWSGGCGSVLLRANADVSNLRLTLLHTQRDAFIRAQLRRFGDLDALLEIEIAAGDSNLRQVEHAISLSPGIYELLVDGPAVALGSSRRLVGPAFVEAILC